MHKTHQNQVTTRSVCTIYISDSKRLSDALNRNHSNSFRALNRLYSTLCIHCLPLYIRIFQQTHYLCCVFYNSEASSWCSERDGAKNHTFCITRQELKPTG